MAVLTSPSLSWTQKVAAAWLGLLVLVAVAAPWLPLPYPPNVPDLAHVAQAPLSPGQHWLGTDAQGLDVLSLLVYGSRTAVFITFPAAVLAAMVGGVLGGAAGFWGNRVRAAAGYWLLALGAAWWFLRLPMFGLGLLMAAAGVARLLWRPRRGAAYSTSVPLDAAVMGVATALDTIPHLVLVLAIAAGTGGVSALGLLAILAFTAWSTPARLVRAQMRRTRALPFTEAAQAAGIPAWQIWLKHAMPHAISPLRAALPLSLARLLGLESTLSFLGVGLPPEVASWGRLMASFRYDTSAWWVFVFPITILTFSMLSLHFLSSAPRRQAAR
ncbi:ABC transporter permease [Hymenobacter armeniacus]|uniref:ABC transporter permease n=1 Tax=Hymenobacter armeniacus TaxID=2771358 RepID=A0ABR8JT01_9BACT|nr:ABC transporter permease [Hymenobacter armeniacus]MBD2722963.1 ABC transporter permease [Hymenobacter armeniacus]